MHSSQRFSGLAAVMGSWNRLSNGVGAATPMLASSRASVERGSAVGPPDVVLFVTLGSRTLHASLGTTDGIGRKLAEDDVRAVGLSQNAIAQNCRARRSPEEARGGAVVHVGRPDPREEAVSARRLEERGDVFRVLHVDSERQDRVGLGRIQSESQHVASMLQQTRRPRLCFRASIGNRRLAPRPAPDRTPACLPRKKRPDARELEMALASGFADVECLAARGRGFHVETY